jgi:hypothetical protein
MKTEQEIMDRLKEKIEALRELDGKLQHETITLVEEYEVMDQLAEAICELEWVLGIEA